MSLRIPTHRHPPTPGEIFVEEFLKPLNITQTAFAKAIGVAYLRLNEIIAGKRRVSVDTAMRFAKATKTSADWWLNMQQVVDLYDAQHSDSVCDIEKDHADQPKRPEKKWRV